MKRPTFTRPKFKSPGAKLAHEGTVKDPLKGLPDIEDPAGAAEQELSQVAKSFRERAAQEQARFGDVTACGYYIVLVFQNEDQCDAFADASGVDHKGEAFVDGRELAKVMGIELPKAETKISKPNINRDYASLTKG